MNKKDKLEKLNVVFSPQSMIGFYITFPNKSYKIEYLEGSKRNIKSITFEGINIGLGDCVRLNVGQKLSYKCNFIKSNGANIFNIKEANYNLATIFAIPFIDNNSSNLSLIKDAKAGKYLVNAYIDCDFIEDKGFYSVYLLLKYSKSDLFKKTEEYLISKPNFKKAIDFNCNYVLYEFEVESKFKKDFDKVLNGDYSKISKIAKNRINNFHKDGLDGSFANNVINRDPQLIKQYEEDLDICMNEIELCSKFGISEILNKKDYECIE